ncbi:MAG: GNAT family N-acetyltransferase, partial [Clostridiales bacterium]|nr:GNAT family N-acetyltransferase [Clostridiales bacterium]
ESAKLLSELAESIWNSHYKSIISQDQISYMTKKFQSESAIKDQINFGGYVYYIAYWDGTPAGYCGIIPDPPALMLSKLYVDEAFRRKGIARSFLRQMLEDFKPTLVWLTVNKHNASSIEAYKKMGFEVVESMTTDIGNGYVMDDYRMALEIL